MFYKFFKTRKAQLGHVATELTWKIGCLGLILAIAIPSIMAYRERKRETEKKEQIEKKIANCNQAISINPNSADAYYNRGAVYDDLKEYHKAIEDYNKTINLDSKHVEAYYNRGFANKKLGKYQQALEDCTQFIDLFPKSAVAYNNRAVLHYDFSRLGPACADWQKACELGDCTGLNWGKNVGHCK